MSSALVEAAAHPISPDAATFASLPLPLTQRVFLALPPDARGRACCVCRAWRDALADPLLWTRLVVRAEEKERFFSVLRGAAGRARSELYHLDVSQHEVPSDVLLQVLTASAGSLRALHLRSLTISYGPPNGVTHEEVFAAAPLLQVLAAEFVWCSWEEAPQMLRAEPPFAPLQMLGSLQVCFAGEEGPRGMECFRPFAAALADAALHPALSDITFELADTAQPDMMGALVDAALARRLRELKLDDCEPPAVAPLARLLAEGSLTAFEVRAVAGSVRLLDAAGDAALVADALRVNSTLTKLNFWGAHLCVEINRAVVLLSALVGHPSLCTLVVVGQETAEQDRIAFGAALGALIAADAPALRSLNCSYSRLGDAGLAPIVEALPLNRHLLELNLCHNGMSEAFARERLLPAVRANTTLRELECTGYVLWAHAAEEAEELVRRRWQHD